MANRISQWLIEKVGLWLTKEGPPVETSLSNFKQICQEVRPADVILVNGKTRASNIIKVVTQSPWSHAALYIGRLQEIKDLELKEKVKKYCKCHIDTQLLIESEIGIGTTISPLNKYQHQHIRIVRPEWISDDDVNKVIAYAISRLGREYHVRHILDLARFLFPWSIFPRKWRSSLFEKNALQPTKDICSSMIAKAFQSVRYPILPIINKRENQQLEYIIRNPRLFTPSDFDYSPYFSVIKYPIYPSIEKGAYSKLPWKEGVFANNEEIVNIPLSEKKISISPQIKRFFTSEAFAVVGASPDRAKYGNKILRCYLKNGLVAHPINPKHKEIEGVACLKSIAELPENVKSLSIITPPSISEKIVHQAIKQGIDNIWFQPGSESALAIKTCKSHNLTVIAKGPCVLVELGCS